MLVTPGLQHRMYQFNSYQNSLSQYHQVGQCKPVDARVYQHEISTCLSRHLTAVENLEQGRPEKFLRVLDALQSTRKFCTKYKKQCLLSSHIRVLEWLNEWLKEF